uniref:hypothetical protein n=1 Tax=Pseudomonas fluorescens TaxID=294 RepID=UPI00130E569B|nr:hypothetical protein [Pseudomonas fluorescens]
MSNFLGAVHSVGAGNETCLGGHGRFLALQQGADLCGTERRQQVIHATVLQQRGGALLFGVFNDGNNADMSGAANQPIDLHAQGVVGKTADKYKYYRGLGQQRFLQFVATFMTDHRPLLLLQTGNQCLIATFLWIANHNDFRLLIATEGHDDTGAEHFIYRPHRLYLP